MFHCIVTACVTSLLIFADLSPRERSVKYGVWHDFRNTRYTLCSLHIDFVSRKNIGHMLFRLNKQICLQRICIDLGLGF